MNRVIQVKLRLKIVIRLVMVEQITPWKYVCNVTPYLLDGDLPETGIINKQRCVSVSLVSLSCTLSFLDLPASQI